MNNVIKLPEASSIASHVDALYSLIYYFSWVSFIIVMILMVYFVVRYHRSRTNPDKTAYITGHHLTEISVSLGLLAIVMVFFIWGWLDYKTMITADRNALEISVTAKQWLWEFEYTNGRKTMNEITIPANTPVRFVMTAADVLHSFYVPAFRMKQDVVPNTYTSYNVTATAPGEYDLFCAEFCGTAHSKMLGKIKVVSPEEYKKFQSRWEAEQRLGISSDSSSSTTTASTTSATPAERGAKNFADKGCIACHSVTGQKLVGPALNGLLGTDVELADGSKVKIDENYIRESITNSTAKVVAGYAPIMPLFQGTLSDDEVNSLVAYIKGLK